MENIPINKIPERLEKSLSPLHIWALAIGCIIGWGCFVMPATKFLPEAGPGATIIGFLIGATLLCFVAMAYSYAIEEFPVAGGEYAYAYAGFGKTAAFFCGWALSLGYISIVAINVSATALIVRFFLPGTFEFGALYTIAGWHVFAGEAALMTIVTIMFGIMNYKGVSIAGTFQVILAFALCIGIFSLTAGVINAESFHMANLKPLFNPGRSEIASVLSILAIAPFLFVGFDTIPQAAEEFSFSPKKARNLMIIAILLGGVLYACVTFSVAALIPYKEMLAKNYPWATGEVSHLALGKIGGVVLGTAVLGAVLSGLNGFYIASSRLIFSMARGRFLPIWFAKIHPKHKTPSNSIIFVTLAVILTPWAGRQVVSWVTDMCSVGTGIAYAFTCFTAYKMFKSSNNHRLKAIISFVGGIVSLGILGLLLIPGSPGFISNEVWIILSIWGILGIIFYFTQIKTVSNTPEKEILFSVFGTETPKLFYKKNKQKN